jgi:CBS domain-containing protein
MKIAQIMTTNVVTVPPSRSLKDAAEVMLQERISGLPVVSSNGDVLGVLSETDILFKERLQDTRRPGLLRRRPITSDDDAIKLAARTVGAAMTMPPVTIAANRTVAEAATMMLERGVNRLPVVDADGRLVGLVARSDIVRAFARSDEEIERELREEALGADLWLDASRFEIEVTGGEVRISGEVETEADAEVVRRAVALVPGVVSVNARLAVTS